MTETLGLAGRTALVSTDTASDTALVRAQWERAEHVELRIRPQPLDVLDLQGVSWRVRLDYGIDGAQHTDEYALPLSGGTWRRVTQWIQATLVVSAAAQQPAAVQVVASVGPVRAGPETTIDSETVTLAAAAVSNLAIPPYARSVLATADGAGQIISFRDPVGASLFSVGMQSARGVRYAVPPGAVSRRVTNGAGGQQMTSLVWS